jgi:uncharacterized protein (TIGR03437 family)
MRALLLTALVLNALAAEQPQRHAPAYTIEAIVNSATNRPGPIAPNTLVSVYGTNLCMAERAVSGEDLRGGILPNVLPGTGCRVLVGNLPASIYYASPKQINFLIPSNLLATTVDFQVVMNSLAGPPLRIPLAEIAPGVFQFDAEYAVGTRTDGSAVTPSEPALPGETIVLYGTGLGRTTPAAIYSQIATTAARVTRSPDFRMVLQGVDIERERILYVGLTPGFAGLYQMNVKLPESAPANPEIRIGFGETLSPEGVKLPLKDVPPRATAEQPE